MKKKINRIVMIICILVGFTIFYITEQFNKYN